MSLVLATLAFVVGACLLATSVASAAFYTPFTGSIIDTLMTAATGFLLQMGCFVTIGGATAFVFEVFAAGGVTFPVFVPVGLAYAVSHLTVYFASVRITDLQETPFDPDMVAQRRPFHLVVGTPAADE